MVTSEEMAQLKVVGWDVDLTGRRLIDEIFHLAAYTPEAQFSQYIMPFADLSPAAVKRYSIRVVTVSRYRMLKDLRLYKFVKSKSEISALNDFLAWLEQCKGDSADGIVLVAHETRKVAPTMLLVALERHGLLERFKAVVKGFANCHSLASAKCAAAMKSLSLKVLSRVLLNENEDLSSARDRAKVCYNVVQHLSLGERQDLKSEGSGDCGATVKHMQDLVRQFMEPVTSEEQELVSLKGMLKRQKTFMPIFHALLRSPYQRQQANRLRRLLAENDIDFDRMDKAWQDGAKENVKKLLEEQVKNANEKDRNELLEILECFFDPTKEPVQPRSKPRRDKKREPRTAGAAVNGAATAKAAAGEALPANGVTLPAETAGGEKVTEQTVKESSSDASPPCSEKSNANPEEGTEKVMEKVMEQIIA